MALTFRVMVHYDEKAMGRKAQPDMVAKFASLSDATAYAASIIKGHNVYSRAEVWAGKDKVNEAIADPRED